MMQGRDWTQLPSELLGKIASHLPLLPDLFRFRSVCVPWRSASTYIKNLPPQPPWLYLETNLGRGKSDRRFFSLFESRFYTIPLPKYRQRWMFSSPSGWILTSTYLDFENGILYLSVVNPLTHSSIPVPPLTRSPEAVRSRKIKIFKTDLVAVIVCSGGPGIFFCNLGETTWKKIDASSCSDYSDLAYHNGCFYAFNWDTKSTSVFDIQTLQKVAEIPSASHDQHCEHYLVESSMTGELMLVLRNQRHKRKRFELFQLDSSDKQQLKWIELSSIGGDVLFVDSEQAMCFNASDFKGCRGNCIYFLNYYNGHKRGYGWPEACGLRLFDIGESQVEPVLLLSDDPQTRWWSSTWVVLGL